MLQTLCSTWFGLPFSGRRAELSLLFLVERYKFYLRCTKIQGSEIQSNSMAFNSITLDQTVLGSNEAFGAVLVIYQQDKKGLHPTAMLPLSRHAVQTYMQLAGHFFSSQRI